MRKLKAVLHAHSTWSYDGVWSLHSIATLYGALGIQAVLMTEHDTGFNPSSFEAYREDCARSSTSRCVLIPGIEYSSPDNGIHILTWGLHRFLAEHRPVDHTLKAIQDAGGVAVFAHPSRRDAWQHFDDTWIPYLSGIELWNRKSDGFNMSSHALELLKRTHLPPIVGTDFHRLRQMWPLTQVFDIDPEMTLPHTIETEITKTLRERRSTPHAFGKSVSNNGAIQINPIHERLENTRRKLRSWRSFIRSLHG